MNAFKDLMAFQSQTEALSQVAGRLGWDQETVMPVGAAQQRGEEMAAMENVLHARRIAPQVADWLAKIEDSTLDLVGQAQMRHIRKSFARTQKVPADLAAEIAKVTSQAQGQWAQARSDKDTGAFVPVLENVVRLKREEGQALASNGDVYDAMIDDYEPDMTAAELAAMFDEMRPRLVNLRSAALEAPSPRALFGHYPEKLQLALSQKLADAFGYDGKHGRIDKAVHPFSSGSGQDVRITTRVSEDDPFNCFYSTIHEVGHACYEQNIDNAYLLTPLGQGVSMGVHESQSRIYENQIGRSQAFTGWLFEQMKSSFDEFDVPDATTFFGTVNRVNKGYIRTEADEVQYNLHVMLRFDLERALMRGDLSVKDLEAAWNDRFEADFGYAVDKPSNGVLQDVHWSVGLFGYFPTYALGNVYAGCLYDALRQDCLNLDAELSVGNTVGATNWLKANLQTHGGLRSPRETIEFASGMAPSPKPFLGYLEAKFGQIYQL
ncbi:carboxypeptidase M32 [Cognatishimia sp. WU-CL00825]|uniref:carboxypeptidase M32 n=1 Tax=Cognatishimia sp. WU-CL00825 TaxID=3127658 RepID=UPI0031073A1B